ncbi:MAG: prepilin-type N-terminal cleavage/methylation domain-containing protein, partial [Sedimentisphaerales bacterium]|nr:prepilin-type N-terminal cleavage/methylation domain-containing protein [Sedimentisphaerales bacterium]
MTTAYNTSGKRPFTTAGSRSVVTAGRRAFTLVEMLVVILIVAIMISLIVPASNAFVYSYKASSAQNLVRSALAQAQAYAAKERRYAGIRFQYDAEGWEHGRQYLILIERTPAVDNEQYQAVPNVTPVSLPAGMGALSGVVG